MVFSGVGKLAAEIDQALQAGILLFNVESSSELELLAARAAHLRKPAQFAIRVNPACRGENASLHLHRPARTQVRRALARCRRALPARRQERYLTAAGVSVHIGSQITDVGPFRETMERVAALVRSLRAEGLDIRYVDAGGGLGISYENGRRVRHSPAKPDNTPKRVRKPLKGLGVHLLLEPGRAIVGPAGVLLTRVLYRKRNDGKQFVVVDAAMNDLLRPSLYDAYHEIVPVVFAHLEPASGEKVDVVGPVCETGDFFARDRMIHGPQEGDLLAILDTGAYGMSLASNYNYPAASGGSAGGRWRAPGWFVSGSRLPDCWHLSGC